MPNRILLIFITLLLGIGSASAQKYPERSLVRKGNRDSRRSGTTAASNATRRRSKRPPKTSRPPTTWGAPSTVPKIRGGGQDARTHRRRLHPHRPGTGRGFLQPRQRPIQTGKIPGSARKLQELPADESCRPGGQVQLRLHQATAAKTAERGSKQRSEQGPAEQRRSGSESRQKQG